MRTNRFTLQQRLLILKTFHESKLSMVKTLRALKSSDLFAKTNVPSINAVRQLVRKFEKTGQLSDMPRSGRSRSARTQENINKVRESLHNKPDISVRCRALELGMNRTTMCTILKKDLKWEGNYDDELEDSDVSINSDNDSVEFVLNKMQPQHPIMNNIDEASIISTSATLLGQDDAINEFNVNEISHNDSLDCQTEVLPPLLSDLLGGVNYNKAISYTPLDTGNNEEVFDVILNNNNDIFNNNIAIDDCNKNKENS